MIGLGTPESRKCSIKTIRNPLLWADCIYYEILLLCVNSKWVCPCTSWYKGLDMETLPSGPCGGSTGVSASQHHQPSGCYVPVCGESWRIMAESPMIIWQPRKLVQEHLMARQLLFHMLTLPNIKGCPWWMLKLSYVVPIRHLTRGHLFWARMLGYEHQCLLEQGCLDKKHQCSQPNSSEQGCPE